MHNEQTDKHVRLQLVCSKNYTVVRITHNFNKQPEIQLRNQSQIVHQSTLTKNWHEHDKPTKSFCKYAVKVLTVL